MRVQCGEIRIDGDSRQIWRGSEPIHLTRKAFDLLLLLLNQRPAVVSAAAIHAALWPDTFVSESSLQRLVFEVRQALGDDGQRQALVRTVHGVGYAFGGEATVIDDPRASAVRVLAWLVAATRRVPLREGENILGRAGDEVIVIDAATISRRHARIVVSDGAWVEDLGSKNGTWVGETKIEGPTPLADGDAIRLGSVQFTFRRARGTESTATLTGMTPS